MDTSVLNFTRAEETSLQHQKNLTSHLLHEIINGRYQGFISDLVIVEVNRAPESKAKLLNELIGNLDVESLSLDDEAEELADKYIEEGIIPLKHRNDALHIAIASVHNLDAAVSWNFQHMVKLKTKRGVAAVNMLRG